MLNYKITVIFDDMEYTKEVEALDISHALTLADEFNESEFEDCGAIVSIEMIR